MKKNEAAVYLNGNLVGFHPNPKKLVEKLRKLRREGKIDPQVNVTYYEEYNEVVINTDAGRIRVPRIVVENGKPKLTEEIKEKIRKGEIKWKDLVKMGIIEYLDAEEEENALIAATEKDITDETTHLEIDPNILFGVVASTLPYQNHNSSPRITMASAMAKQSLGYFASNFRKRYDTKAYIMYYPQQPLVQTTFYQALNFKRRAAGQNFVVAVLSYRGWNMEDAVVVNKSAVDRGLARAVMFKTYETEERQYPAGQKDEITIPTIEVQGYRGEDAYKKLGEDGVVEPETEVEEGDVIIGKVSPPRFAEESSIFGQVEEVKRDASVSLKEGEEGVVDSVIIGEGATGNKLVKVRIRSIKIPEIGDKFASRHGQKGVIGLLVPQEDMPFTKDGIVPDLIINPHAIPSRMTAGHLIEMLGGKAAALEGEIMNGSSFNGDPAEKFAEILKKHGFEEWGEEELYDGITGKKIKAKIFVGIIYYQRLHHLVSNKIHARARGPVQLLTKQPTEGRAREGGLRLGEMERDCLIGYGASAILRERLLDNSDRAVIYVCNDCGCIAYYDKFKNKLVCPMCKGVNISEIEMSYAFKLLLEEITCLHIFPKLKIGEKGEE